MSRAKIAAIGVIGALAVVGIFLLGGYYGFVQGYQYSVSHGSIAAAYQAVSALESLNAGKTLTARKKLELRLDTLLIEHWSGMVYKPYIDLRFFAEDDKTAEGVMEAVVKYRKKHPSKAEDPDVRAAIEAVIAAYRK